MKKLSLGRKKGTENPKGVEAPAVSTAPAASKKKASKEPRPVKFRGKQIGTTGAYLSSALLFWWRISGPSPAVVQAGVQERFGRDGLESMRGPMYQNVDGRSAFTYLLKRDVRLALKRRALHQAALERVAKDRQRKAAAVKKVPAPAPEQPAETAA